MPEISDMLSSATVPLIAENKSLRDENADLAKRIAALEQRELPSLEGYVTAETAKSLVTDAVATAIAEIPVPQDGQSIDPADVQAMVDKAVAALPAPDNGDKGLGVKELLIARDRKTVGLGKSGSRSLSHGGYQTFKK